MLHSLPLNTAGHAIYLCKGIETQMETVHMGVEDGNRADALRHGHLIHKHLEPTGQNNFLELQDPGNVLLPDTDVNVLIPGNHVAPSNSTQ